MVVVVGGLEVWDEKEGKTEREASGRRTEGNMEESRGGGAVSHQVTPRNNTTNSDDYYLGCRDGWPANKL